MHIQIAVCSQDRGRGATAPSRSQKYTSMNDTKIDFTSLSGFGISTLIYSNKLGNGLSLKERSKANCTYTYKIRDKALKDKKYEDSNLRLAICGAGSVVASCGENRFATELCCDGDESDLFCFTTPLQGTTALVRNGEPISKAGASFAWRANPATRLLFSDGSARTNVFLKVEEVVEALEHRLDERLRRPLEFSIVLDWSEGLGSSLKRQLDNLLFELSQPNGLASNLVALTSLTDLLISLALDGIPHNYSDRLNPGPNRVVPAYVRRAEDFMRARCADPIRMVDVAVAAGCSVGTLGGVFRHFRGKTPLNVLHAIRLEQAKCELMRGKDDVSIATVARRYGFTNSGRFKTAFQRRFGEAPLETARRAPGRGELNRSD
jgi:AraC-like DNA-binding protein